MTEPAQGEVWWAEAGDKRRPVLVVTRDVAVPALNRILVAPITSTVRRLPTEIALGRDDGLDRDCCASFDNVRPLHKVLFGERVSPATPGRRQQICAALAALADC